jgi:uncharacterized protein (TIGR02300 family)
LSCGARFYDLGKHPIVCPSCGTNFEPEAFVRTRRGRPAPAEAPKAVVARPVVPAVEAEADVDVDDVLPADDDEESDGEAEEEEVLEDASELGEDDDDMAEIVENVDSKEKEP